MCAWPTRRIALGGDTPGDQLPRHRQGPRRRRRVRRRRRPPRLRLPVRERRLRPGRPRRRADLDRPAARGHPRARRQGAGPAHRRSAPARRWSPAPPTRSPAPTRSSPSPRSTACPIAIKAAFGGGGRGLKVARTLEEVPELYDSAVREAVAAFGRGECFVERYLDKPRHVETQCLADTARQRRRRLHPRLLAAAPPPEAGRGGARAVPDRGAERASSTRASKAILKEAGYVGAGTCEFLVGQDGTISFLEVNTRLQVEHPVTEEVTGIDLVREMFRIADGEELGYDDPELRGHSFEFRINGEDPGRSFLPAPGTVTTLRAARRPRRARWTPASSPAAIGPRRVRLAARQADRHRRHPRAGARARRAARWPSSRSRAWPPPLPFHRAVVAGPGLRPDDDGPFTVHTRWIETEFDNTIPPFAGAARPTADEAGRRETVVVEVGGKRLEVVAARRPRRLAPAPAGAAGAQARSAAAAQEGRRRPRPATRSTSPDAGHHRQGRRRGGPAGRGGRPRSSSSRR